MENKNPHLDKNKDFWYHLGILPSQQIKADFHDVKFVCCGGKPSRMKSFAEFLYQKLNQPQNSIFEADDVLKDITASAGRYSMYKVGPCISVSHGMGMPSFSILLHEIFKLLVYAECKDVLFIRIGSSGGLGLEPGTTVITDQAYSSLLQPYFTQISCGKEVKYESKCDFQLCRKLLEISKELKINAIIGGTISCNDFYEEQGRLDGALCSFTPQDKMDFLKKAHSEFGVRNIEMEVNMMAAMCTRMEVKCATICATLVNRLVGDEVLCSKEDIKKWELYPQQIVAELISKNI